MTVDGPNESGGDAVGSGDVDGSIVGDDGSTVVDDCRTIGDNVVGGDEANEVVGSKLDEDFVGPLVGPGVVVVVVSVADSNVNVCTLSPQASSPFGDSNIFEPRR